MASEHNSEQATLNCYNKGCRKQFTKEQNSPDACEFHPGGPIFHDALKGWSCCKKRTTDFTEFLNIKGCTKGFHNSENPVPQPVVPQETQSNVALIKEVPKPPREPNPVIPVERPRSDEPFVPIPITVGATLKDAIAKLRNMEVSAVKNADSDEIQIGTSCKRTSCGKSYEGQTSNNEQCLYHAGSAVFHEGMKYWSCCQKKTSNFDDFLKQPGCTKDVHLWIKTEPEINSTAVCRHDWHQTAGMAILTVYCKVAEPDKSSIVANQVVLQVNISYDGGRSTFIKNIILEGAIDPARSSVKMLGTKVEIKLRKVEGFSWKNYEIQEKEQQQE